MKLTINELCEMIEKAVPGTHCRPISNIMQASVTFDYRPEKVISLLTPYLQTCMKRGGLPDDDLQRLIDEVRGIATFKIL